MIKPITITFSIWLRNDDVWSRKQNSYGCYYCEKRENYKAQSINYHCCEFPILRDVAVLVLLPYLKIANSKRDRRRGNQQWLASECKWDQFKFIAAGGGRVAGDGRKRSGIVIIHPTKNNEGSLFDALLEYKAENILETGKTMCLNTLAAMPSK